VTFHLDWHSLHNALLLGQVTHLKQLTKVSEDEVKQLHGIGSNGLAQLQRALAEKGMAFADKKQKGKDKQ
jgi:DNA repair protein RadC